MLWNAILPVLQALNICKALHIFITILKKHFFFYLDKSLFQIFIFKKKKMGE